MLVVEGNTADICRPQSSPMSGGTTPSRSTTTPSTSRTAFAPPPRFILNPELRPPYPTRTRALQSLIESPLVSRRPRSSSVDDAETGKSRVEAGIVGNGGVEEVLKERRMSAGAAALQRPEMRSMRLIGPRNSRYEW